MIPSDFHPSLDQLQKYLAESLPDFEMADLEDHFSECQECMATVRRMDSLLFSGFTARAHAASIAAEAFQTDPLANALRAAQRTYGEYAGTLRDWLESAAALWEAGVPRSFGEIGDVPVSRLTETPVRVTLAANETRGIVHVHKNSMAVEVEVAGAKESVVVLFPKEGEGDTRAASLHQGIENSSVRFENVSFGEYYLAVAPMQKKEQPPQE